MKRKDAMALVVTHDEAPQLAAANRLNDRFRPSAAVVDGEFYLRGERHLYCLAHEGVVSEALPRVARPGMRFLSAANRCKVLHRPHPAASADER